MVNYKYGNQPQGKELTLATKTFDFGKIDYCGRGRKINPVTVEVTLTEDNGKHRFSAMAMVYNQTKTDILAGGQCLDSIAKRTKNKQFMEIYRLWKLYHLNDMHAGTIEQEEAIKDWESKGNRYDYTSACEYLKSVGLYEVEHNGKPYTYGSGWLYWDIPEDDLKIIQALFD